MRQCVQIIQNQENIYKIINFDPVPNVANQYTLVNWTYIGAGQSSVNYKLITVGGTVERGVQPPQIQMVCSSGCPKAGGAPVPCN